MKPRRRIAFWGSILIVVPLAALWARSTVRIDWLQWVEAGRLERNISVRDGQMGSWSYYSIDWELVSCEGVISLARSEYESVDASDEALLGRWTPADRGLHWRSDSKRFSLLSEAPRFWRGPGEWQVAGLGTFNGPGKGATVHAFQAPYWLLVSLASAPIMIVFVRGRTRRHRAARNQCPACGYPAGISDRCTECGAPAAKAQ